MTALIVILSILAYTGIGLPVSVYSRNRSFNKSFKRWYGRTYSSTEEGKIREAIKDTKRYDSMDYNAAAVLGGFFWPFFLIGFSLHFIYLKLLFIEKFLPKTDPEKMLVTIERNKALEAEKKVHEKELKEAIKLLKAVGMKEEDITIGQSNRIK